LISNDFFSFLNFLYVNNVIDINENDLEEKTIKKFVFRLIIDLRKKEVIEIKKISIFNEDKNEVKYSNFIYIKDVPKPKNLFLLFKISNEKSTIKERKNIILIGFYHYLMNTKLIQKKNFKKESILHKNFIKSVENRANTKFFPDWRMIENIKEKTKEIKKNSIEKNLKDLKRNIIIKKLIQEEKINLDNDFEQIKKIKSKISKIQKELSLNIDF
jgi:hypothetical protein